MLPDGRLHDVNDDGAHIDEYPLTRLPAFYTMDFRALGFELFLHVARQR